jgi:regulator of RNase E activity RraA
MTRSDVEITADIRKKLKATSTATLPTQLFKRGFQNRFLVGCKPFNPAAASFVAEAFTLRFIPAREDLDTLESIHRPGNLQWAAIERCPPGKVLVIDSREDIRAASSGFMLITHLFRRGVAAAVTDGAFRDGPAIAKMDFPVYARAMTASTSLSFFHAAELDCPIGCAGVAVFPGDVLVGDSEGIVVIPRHLAQEVADDGFAQEQLEDYIYTRVDAGESLQGLYPPNDATRAAYDAWRTARDGKTS